MLIGKCKTPSVLHCLPVKMWQHDYIVTCMTNIWRIPKILRLFTITWMWYDMYLNRRLLLRMQLNPYVMSIKTHFWVTQAHLNSLLRHFLNSESCFSNAYIRLHPSLTLSLVRIHSMMYQVVGFIWSSKIENPKKQNLCVLTDAELRIRGRSGSLVLYGKNKSVLML